MKSKRSALRFPCSNILLSYKTAYDEGEARLVNISIDGCAFEQPSLALPLQEKVLISFTLPGEDYAFEARGIVVREDVECTAIRFTLVEKEDQVKMRKHFSKMMRTK
ncbi:PilZ domain-containing protein [Desulforhopalus sp. 52FAK]